MQTSTLALHVQDWSEVLYGQVPEEELNECYLVAVRSSGRQSGSTFPIKHTEILEAYRRRAAVVPRQASECEFCRMYKYDPTEFPVCSLHRPLSDQPLVHLNERMLDL